MQQVAHDSAVRDFSVVRVGVVDGMVLALAHVRREGFAEIWLLRFVGRAVVFDELAQPWVRAGGVIGWVGQRQDLLVLAAGKTFNSAEFRVFMFLRSY